MTKYKKFPKKKINHQESDGSQTIRFNLFPNLSKFHYDELKDQDRTNVFRYFENAYNLFLSIFFVSYSMKNSLNKSAYYI